MKGKEESPPTPITVVNYIMGNGIDGKRGGEREPLSPFQTVPVSTPHHRGA